MELHRFFRYAIEKMCKEKKSLNHFYVNNPYYKLIREFHGNHNIAKICSSQSHIDYKDEDLIKIINTYNKCNWINALLFSNSPHIVNSNKTILCYRDYIWKFSSHGRDSNNILISKEFNDIEDLNAFNNSKLIFMVYKIGRAHV